MPGFLFLPTGPSMPAAPSLGYQQREPARRERRQSAPTMPVRCVGAEIPNRQRVLARDCVVAGVEWNVTAERIKHAHR
jgi:hypothetical protein